jgi:hypothetical protein
MGQAIPIKDLLAENINSHYVRMYDYDQGFLGISKVLESGLQPIVVLNPIN